MVQGLTVRDYLAILRRRIWWFLIPAVLLSGAAFAAAMLWPPTYRSSATVLIEEAEIPDSILEVGFSSYVERRIEAITRRVMVTDNLIGIIERYGLYTEERVNQPLTAIAGRMRSDIRIRTLSADVVNPRTGSRGQATVAFELSFEYGVPETAQRVSNELVSLYLNENIRQRRARITETAAFLGQERERLETRIVELSQELASFKAANSAALPEQAAFNQQMLVRIEAELRDLDRQEQSLRDRETMLTAQLAQVEPNRVFAGGAQSFTTPGAQLEAARAELSTLTARYGPSHPDVVKARREVAALQQLTGRDTGSAALGLERTRLDAELQSLRQTYSAEHPDVRRAERQLASIDASLQEMSAGNGQGAEPAPDNPAYMALVSQLGGIRNQLEALDPQRQQARQRYATYEELLARTPVIEQDYNRILSALADVRARRDAMFEREQTARLGQAIETEQRGERFSLIEPPTLPTAPEKPNRRLILLVGLVLSMGAGAGSVAMRQMLDDTVTGPGDVTAEIGIEPLGVVPNITTPGERARGFFGRLMLVALVVAGLAAAAWYVHQRIVPLDTAVLAAWREIVTRIGPYLPSDLQSQLGLGRP